MAAEPAMSPSWMPVADVLAPLPERRQREAAVLMELMQEVTGAAPVVWAKKILGFGEYHYRYVSGHGGVAPMAAFAPTARHQTIYLASDFQTRYPKLVADLTIDPTARRGLPRYSTACLYVTSLDTIRLDVLRTLIERTCNVYRGMDEKLVRRQDGPLSHQGTE